MRTYLALIVIDAIRQAGDTLVYPACLNVNRVPLPEFLTRKAEEAARSYNPFELITGIEGLDDEQAKLAKEDQSARALGRL
jgi:hypothetical protein